MRVLRNFLLFLIIAALAAALAFHWLDNYYHSPTNFSGNGYVVIEKGSGINKAAEALDDAGVIKYPRLFAAIAKYEKKTNPKFGEYLFTPDLTREQILDKINKGETIVRKVVVPEGKSVIQIFDILRNSEKLKPVIDQANLPQEGTLMPSTYIYHYGDTDKDIVEQMQKSMAVTLDQLWQKRAANLPFKTKEEALTLASIVEKETGLDSERPLVASVFINRLNKGMKLESDPTAVYGITHGAELGRKPNADDIKNNNPYNTYIIPALPPGPICNPGAAAIAAVLNPPSTEYIYFVATGSGGHNFATTYQEHAANVQKLRDYLKIPTN